MEELSILGRIISLIFIVAISGSVISLIWLGVKYFKSSSETDKTRNFIIYVIAGLILLIIASSVPTLIISFLKQYQIVQ